MDPRRKRLGKLIALQKKVKAMHETRNAQHLQAAIAAAADAEAIVARFDAEDSLSSLFPDLYHRRAMEARDREARARAQAAKQANLAAVAGLRGDIVQRAYREASLEDERDSAQREMLEFIERSTSKPAK